MSLSRSGSKTGMQEDDASVVSICSMPALLYNSMETRAAQETEMNVVTPQVHERGRRSLALKVVVHDAMDVSAKSSRFYTKVTLGCCGKTAKTTCSRVGLTPTWEFSTCFDYDGEDGVLFEVRSKKFLCSTRTVGFASISIGSIACGWEGDLILYSAAESRESRNGTLRVSFSWPYGSMSKQLRDCLSKTEQDDFAALLLRVASDDGEKRHSVRARSPCRGMAHVADEDTDDADKDSHDDEDDEDDENDNDRDHASGDMTADALRLSSKAAYRTNTLRPSSASTLPNLSASSSSSTLRNISKPCSSTSLRNLSPPSSSSTLQNLSKLTRSTSLENLPARASSTSLENLPARASSTSLHNISTRASSTSLLNPPRLSTPVSPTKPVNLPSLSITPSPSSPRHVDDGASCKASTVMGISPCGSVTREFDNPSVPSTLTPSHLKRQHKDGTGEVVNRLSMTKTAAAAASIFEMNVAKPSFASSLSFTSINSFQQSAAGEPSATSSNSNVSLPKQLSFLEDECWEMDHRWAWVGDGSKESLSNADIAARTSNTDSVGSVVDEVEQQISKNPFLECSESTLITMKKLAVTNNNHTLAAQIRDCQLQRIKKNIQKAQTSDNTCLSSLRR
eukprot:GEMP01016753.1.p1 GENE.GEMP01016753.1~~GEMP01016753.1.p1  ORF type:complete len:623 (+),score=79.42 GEMP01016753.1:186-2054(+)